MLCNVQRREREDRVCGVGEERAASWGGHGRRGRKGRQRQRGGESGGGSEGMVQRGQGSRGEKSGTQLARCVDRACWNGVGAMRWFMVMAGAVAVEGLKAQGGQKGE